MNRLALVSLVAVLAVPALAAADSPPAPPAEKAPASPLARCVARGVQHFKEIGSYPTLTTPPNAGRKAEEVARERCERFPHDFGS
jgi:hypothetical protein